MGVEGACGHEEEWVTALGRSNDENRAPNGENGTTSPAEVHCSGSPIGQNEYT